MAREMKDSGIEWAGTVPDSWNINSLSQLFVQVKNKNSNLQETNLLSLSYGKIKRRSIESSTGLLPESFDGYNIIEKDDVVLRLTDLQNDQTSLRVGLAEERGIITSAYLTIRKQAEISAQYLFYYLYSFDISKGFYGMGGGVRQGLNWDGVKWLKVLVPPFDEQERIAIYLSQKCAEIDAMLEKTRTSIEEYKKLKQAIITQAVTKGIRGDRPMKESGIEWIPLIPDNWLVCKTLYCLSMPITDGPHTTPDLYDEGIPFVSAEAVSCGNGLIDFSHIRGYISEEFYIECCKKYVPEIDDIYMIKSGATTGRVAIVDTDRVFTIWSPLAVFRCNPNIAIPKYIFYFLQSIPYQKQIELRWSYGTQQNIGMRTLERLKVCLPPLDEQKEIVEHLKNIVSGVDSIIKQKEQILLELESYKKSLIYEYVTGKSEVQQQVKEVIVYPFFPAAFQASSPRFAQAILMSKVLDSCRIKMGRVKLEKMMFVLENSIGFNFETEYVREAAGPLDKSIYACEKIISKQNKWFTIRKSAYGVSYQPTKDAIKYKKYYDQYFANYANAINHVIDIFRDFNADQAEVIATLYGAWNDFIIDKKSYTDDDIVEEVLNNWNDTKKRFSKDVWLRAIQRMRDLDLVPHGYGRHTVVKEENNLG